MSHPLHRRAFSAFLATTMVVTLAPLPALAAEAQPVLVVPYANLGDVPEELGPKTAEMVATELKSNENLKVVDVPGVGGGGAEAAKAEPAADPAAERDIQEARELVE